MSANLSTTNQNTILAAEWLEAKSKVQSEITMDIDLLEYKILDSLQFMTFIVYLEELSGREIDMSTVSLDAFRTLRSIEQEFFSEATV
ncbi:MAG: acyl carrier protein [Burkholderiales bacterium]|nr:acyl carrier protein [Burkholderiales bacterium]